MSRVWQFKRDEEISKPVGLLRLMQAARARIQTGNGPFSITVDGESEEKDLERKRTLSRIKSLAQKLGVGPTVRVKDNVGDIVFLFRESKPAAEVIDTSGNQKIDKVWSAVKAEYSFITFLGAYVCKVIYGTTSRSQHSYGNAVDIGAPALRLQEIAEWLVARSDEFSLEHVIYKNRIWSRGQGWHAYTGTYHATHVHVDCDPNYSGDCGVRG